MSPLSVSFNKSSYYENVTRMARWFAIAIVAGTIPWSDNSSWPVLVLMAGAATFNLLRYWPTMMAQRWFAGKLTLVVVDSVYVVMLLALTGGIKSPYYLFFIFIIITAAYWYGLKGVFGVLAASLLASLVFAARIGVDVTPSDPIRQSVIALLSILNIGYLAERLTDAERRERQVADRMRGQIESEQQRLLALINSLAEGVLAIDERDQVTLYNGAVLELLNTNLELAGASLHELLPLLDSKGRPIDIISRANKTRGTLRRDDLVLDLHDGRKINLDVSVAPVHSYSQSHPGQSGYILVLRDVTRDRNLQEQRDEFLSVVSHELRTPLAIAEANISTAMLPKFGQIPTGALELIEQAHQNIVFLGELIKDITALARIEQSALSLDLKTIDPAQLIEQLVRDYKAEAEAKNLVLVSKTHGRSTPILTSEYRVHEILQNFITNAIKYTEKGSVTVSVEPAHDGEGVTFSVADTGIGISKDDQKHLFTKFYRSEDERARRNVGTGLGLYITAQLAERLNAKIWFKSELNHGSTFYLKVKPIDQKPGAGEAEIASKEAHNFVEAG